jgi:hypothetical protein
MENSILFIYHGHSPFASDPDVGTAMTSQLSPGSQNASLQYINFPLRPLAELLSVKRLAWSWGLSIHYQHLPFMLATAICRVRALASESKFREAYDFFCALDPDTRLTTRVALEYGRLLWMQGQCQAALALLSYARPLSTLPGQPSSYFREWDDPHDECLTAMSVLSACVTFEANGITRAALRTLASFPDWRTELDLEKVAEEFNIDQLAFLDLFSPVIGPGTSILSVNIPYSFTGCSS